MTVKQRKTKPLTPEERQRLLGYLRRGHYETGSKEFLISDHWYRLRHALTFDRERILRLCEAMQVTPRELAMMMRYQPGTSNGWIRGESPHPSAAIHLLMFERAALGMLSPEADKPLFPEGVIGE